MGASVLRTLDNTSRVSSNVAGYLTTTMSDVPGAARELMYSMNQSSSGKATVKSSKKKSSRQTRRQILKKIFASGSPSLTDFSLDEGVQRLKKYRRLDRPSDYPDINSPGVSRSRTQSGTQTSRVAGHYSEVDDLTKELRRSPRL